MTTTVATSLNPSKPQQPQTKKSPSIPQSPRVKSKDEWNTWRQSYITAAAEAAAPSANSNSKKPATDDNTSSPNDDDALEASRQWIINRSKTGALNDNLRFCTLLLRLLCEQQEFMDRQVSKPWTIIRPVASDPSAALVNDGNEKPTAAGKKETSKQLLSESSLSMLRQIEWHVVLLLELWIHHGERLVNEIYPRLLVLQHSRREAQKKEETEKRKWKKMNRPAGKHANASSSTDSNKSKMATKKTLKKTKHGKESTISTKFSASAFVQKQLCKFEKVMEQSPSLTNRMQTATPQDKELQLLNHIATVLSQAAFFLPAEQSMTSFLTQKCLTMRIWKALPQVITHVYEDLERVNPYLETTNGQTEDPFASVNILTTTKKKKKKSKTTKSNDDKEPEKLETVAPSRPKLLPQKKNRFQAAGGHFNHRSRAAQSTMSKVLEHLSPVRRKSSIALSPGSKGIVVVSHQKAPRNGSATTTSASCAGKSNKYLSRNSSQLVTPHGSKSAKGAAVKKTTPKLSLISNSSNKANSTSSTTTASNKTSKQPAPVTTAKEVDRPKLQLEPTKSIRRDAEYPLPAQSPQKKSSSNQVAKRKIAAAEDAATLQRSRSQGLFPLSPIATNRSMNHHHHLDATMTSDMTASSTAVMKTPTRKRRSDALLTPVRKPPPLSSSSPLEADDEENERNHGNRPRAAAFLTPQRRGNEQKVAETPESTTFPLPKQRVACYSTTTPVRRHYSSSSSSSNFTNNAVVAETPDTSATKLRSIVDETPQRQSTTVAETPQHPSIATTVVAETPESVVDAAPTFPSGTGGFDSIDWEAPSSSSSSLVEGGGSTTTSMMTPMQLFAKQPQAKKPRRVYSLGGGKPQKQPQQPKKTDKDEMHDRRMATNAVLTQAMAFMRRKSLEGK